MAQYNPEFCCIQESKISEDAIPEEMRNPPGFSSYFSCAERKGYSGVAVYSKLKPLSVSSKMGKKRFDSEGRYIRLDFEDFSLLNIYYPNGKASEERLQYKLDFYDEFLAHADRLRKEGRRLVICGDFNTAHKEIDLARPKENETISGFLPQERAWMDKFVSHGYVDAFRHFDPTPGKYSWWSLRTAARSRNVGWRIDYFFVSDDLTANLSKAEIHSDVKGSDHCPLGLELKFK